MAWSAEQISNSKIIISAGRQVGASDRDIQIALMAAIVESGLRNLNHGSGDSIGLFQQRNAWGSRADRLDPMKSARMFFLGGAQGQRGLLDFKSRNSWDMGVAAQKVQVSAYPGRYAQHEDEGGALLKELGGSVQKPGGHVVINDPGTTDNTLIPAPSATDQGSVALTALGAGSPTSSASNAGGMGYASSPGAESADKQPMLNSLDLTGMVDPGGANTINIPDELQGGFDLGSGDTGGGGSYTPGKYNLPGVKPYVLSAANELGGRYGIKTIGGVGDRAHASDHPGGKALDFMTRGKNGNDLAAFAEANWKRLNIKYIIWNQHIWNPSRAKEGWRLMEDRGGDTNNHVDHVHISFN